MVSLPKCHDGDQDGEAGKLAKISTRYSNFRPIKQKLSPCDKGRNCKEKDASPAAAVSWAKIPDLAGQAALGRARRARFPPRDLGHEPRGSWACAQKRGEVHEP